MIISALAFALLNIFVKSLSQFSVFQIVFFRSLGSLFFTIPLLAKLKISPYGNKKLLLVLRSIVGLASMALFFLSLKYIATASAVSIRYTSPIFAAFLALFFFKEKIKPIQWLFFGVAFSGVVLLKGFDSQLNNLGLFYIIVSAFFSGFVFIIIRKISNQDHPLVIVNYFMVISALLSGVFTVFYWKTPQALEWLVLLSLGVFGYFGQYYMTKAIQLKEVNQVAPLKYIEVVFTMLIGLIWLNETYKWISLLGIVLILLGLSFNLLIKQKR